MRTQNSLAELSPLLVEKGIITTDVLPFCCINPNHTSHTLGRLLREIGDTDIAEAFDITVVELLAEKKSSPSREDAVAALMGRHSGSGTGWLVRFFKPSPRGGFYTKIVFAHTLAEAMHKMLRA